MRKAWRVDLTVKYKAAAVLIDASAAPINAFAAPINAFTNTKNVKFIMFVHAML